MPNGKRPASLRVVLDTNVLISALQFPDGALSGIWPPLQIDEYVLLLSPAIVTELASKLRGKFYWEEPLLRDSLRTLVRKAEIIQPHTLPDAIPEDPADNHILACAVEGKADLIVSGDKDLLRLGAYAGIPIVRPMDFLRALGAEHNS